MTETTLHFGFKNLGPIYKKGEIQNNNITILYGFPNSGKSFLLRGLYSVLSFSDDKMVQKISNYSALRLKNLLESSIQLKSLISDASQISTACEFLTSYIDSKDFENLCQKDFEQFLISLLEKEVQDYRMEEEKDRISFRMERSVKLGFGSTKLAGNLQASFKEFFSLLIGDNSISNLVVNKKPFFLSIKRELNEMRYENINGKIGVQRSPGQTTLDPTFIQKHIETTVDYELSEVTPRDCVINICINILVYAQFRKKGRSDSINEERSTRLFNDAKSKFKYISIRRKTTGMFDFNYRLRSIPSNIAWQMAQKIANLATDHAKTLLKSISEIKEVRYVPVGRTPFLLFPELKFTSDEFFDEGIPSDPSTSLYENFRDWLFKGEKKLGEPNFNSNNVAEDFLLLQGSLSYEQRSHQLIYTDYRSKSINIKYASAMASEVSGIVLSYISMDEPGVILIEEPEAQLHPRSQIIMALTLIAISSKGYRLIFSTHSDIFGELFHFLFKYKPKSDQIVDLLKAVQPDFAKKIYDEKVRNLAMQVSAGLSTIQTNAYFLDQSGNLQAIKPDEFGESVPGITNEVHATLLNWTYKISQNETK